MEIKSLGKISFDAVFEAFNQAFADYEIQLSKAQLQTMLKRRAFSPDLSFAAFEGSKIVAFTLNGIGLFNGVPTAYDTGTGTLKNYRGKGLATQIFEYSIPYLKKMNIEQYLLEVLQHNTKAVSVYRNLGFEVAREFSYYVQSNKEIASKVQASSTVYSIRQINVKDFQFLSKFWDFYPSWQNSFESIERSAEDFVCRGVFAEDRLIGYCVFEPVSGDITQIAVDKQNRRKGVGSLLLNEMAKLNQNDSIKLINADVLCTSMAKFLEARSIYEKGKQFEMVKKI